MPSVPGQWITLSDGRDLAFAEYGDRAGEPVVYLPGSPGNRVNPFLDVWGRECGLRFLAVDRPGYGLSSPRPDQRLTDLGVDIGELADQRRLGRFSLAGVSGGGPAVLACAATLGNRVRTSVVISGVAPPEAPRDGMGASRRAMLAAVDKNPQKYARQMAFGFWMAGRLPAGVLAKAMAPAGTPEADRRLMARDDVRDILLASARSMSWRDGGPTVQEVQLHSRPWGFDLADVTGHVRLWDGSEDTSVPMAAARYTADRLADGHLTEVRDAGHLLMFDRWRDIFTGLRDAAREGT